MEFVMNITPQSSVNRDHISTPTLFAERLVLNGTDATGIARKIDETAKKTDLVAVEAIGDIQETVDNIEHMLDPTSKTHQDQTVMTISVVDRFFNRRDEWQMTDWAIEDNNLYCLRSSTDNQCRIANSSFHKPGMYFLSITLTNLPSGLVKVYFNDTVLMDLERVGTYGFEVEIEDIANDRLYLKSVELGEEERVIISSMGLYFITPRFYDYLITKITSMATVDANNFVSKTMFREEMNKYIQQFEQSAGIFNSKLDAHLTADNPHGITLEMLGGSPDTHTHEQYVDKTTFVTQLELKLLTKADKQHIHEQYVTRDDIPQMVEDTVGDRFNQIMTIPPAIIVLSETGRLPTRFMRTEICEPITLLLPSQLNTGVYGNYSSVYGTITTNNTDMIDSVMKVFLNTKDNTGADLPEDYDYRTPLVIRNCFHTHRPIRGYKLYSDTGTVTSWKVFTGKNTFQHQIDELTEDHIYNFDRTVTTDCLTFAILATDDTPVTGFRIDILLEDPDINKLYFTRHAFTLSMPDKGANRLVSVPATSQERTHLVQRYVDGLPYYFFAQYRDNTTMYYGSFIRPEYGEIRTGVEVFTDNYTDIELDPDEITDTYEHQVFGKLRLLEGATRDKVRNPLTAIYDKTNTSWVSSAATKKVTIEQEITTESTMLRGYTLNWRETDLARIPNTWTLMVSGVNERGDETTIVLDSVEDYFPCYSVEDDDIIYTKSFELNLHINKITLTMAAGKNNMDGLALNQFVLYLSEHFYSIPENTLYRGMVKSTALCLGHYSHDALLGWTPTNLCLGKSTVVPINDLDITMASGVYTIPNPFLTTGVTVTINPYRWKDDQHDTGHGQVLSITPTEITIVTITPAVYTATVTRSW